MLKQITKARRELIHQKYDGHCAYCGSKIAFQEMTVDHLIPRNGGRTPVEVSEKWKNYMPSCVDCNRFKGNDSLSEFRRNLEAMHIKAHGGLVNKVARRYGVIAIKPFDGAFYFEKFEQAQKAKKFSREKVEFDGATAGELRFTYDVYINDQGEFTATIPNEIANQFTEAGLSCNKLNAPGYFASSSLNGLRRKIANVSKDFVSRELIEEEVVIRFLVQTKCRYFINDETEILPSRRWDGATGTSGKSGTKIFSATNVQPFGVAVYARPFWRRKYLFGNGAERLGYERFRFRDLGVKPDESNYYLRWLAQVNFARPPEGETVKDVVYSEPVAKLFAGLIHLMCAINEKIKPQLEPDKISKLASAGVGLLDEKL